MPQRYVGPASRDPKLPFHPGPSAARLDRLGWLRGRHARVGSLDGPHPILGKLMVGPVISRGGVGYHLDGADRGNGGDKRQR